MDSTQGAKIAVLILLTFLKLFFGLLPMGLSKLIKVIWPMTLCLEKYILNSLIYKQKFRKEKWTG